MQILTAYEGTMEGKPEPATTEAYEHSEMLLYKAQVLLEGGSCAAAMALLDAVKVRMGWTHRSKVADGPGALMSGACRSPHVFTPPATHH